MYMYASKASWKPHSIPVGIRRVDPRSKRFIRSQIHSFKMSISGMNGRVRSLLMTVPITGHCIFVRSHALDRPCSHRINAPLARWNTWCARIYNFTLACHRTVSFPIEPSSAKNIHHTRRRAAVPRQELIIKSCRSWLDHSHCPSG